LDAQTVAAPPLRQPDGFDPDNRKFLNGLQQRGRQAMIEESLARVHRDFDAFLEEKVSLNWDEQRRKIFQHFGLAQKDEPVDGQAEASKTPFGRSAKQPKQPETLPPRDLAASGNRSVFGRSGFQKSVIGSPGTGLTGAQLFGDASEKMEGVTGSPDTRLFREKMGYFADKVQRLNGARLEEKTYAVLHEFAEVEEYAGGDVGFSSLGGCYPA
jgi:nuclear pore complex protein Nup93